MYIKITSLILYFFRFTFTYFKSIFIIKLNNKTQKIIYFIINFSFWYVLLASEVDII